jgi:internalin A
MPQKTPTLWQKLTGRGNKTSCYISYSRKDGQTYARLLASGLQARGVDIFRDESTIAAGSQFVDSLRHRLDQVDAVVLVGTPAAFQSDFVNYEIAYCRGRGCRIIPVVFRDLIGFDDVPLVLRDIQWLQEERSALEHGPSAHAFDALTAALRLTEPRELARARPVQTTVEKRSLNEGKLILVGRGEVGKTSLVKRLVENTFNDDESKTQGIRIAKWTLPSATDTVRLNVWDFGGQEMMHATHQFFMTERSLYLLVLNGREGGEDIDAEYWLKHIESFGGDSPVIVVQNKIAQHPFELNYRGLQARYPQIQGFVKTDCKEQVGIQQIRELIKQVVESMPEVRMEFPSDWFNVKERLELMPDEHLDHRDFVGLCNDEGITDESDQDKLALVLHCLGVALTYRDDSRLRETSVLKPEWVTHGIYGILNAKVIADRQGELRLSDLAKILSTRRYPVDKHLFLVELMRKFSLCFPFPDGADRYLVPELLGKEESEDASTFQPERCLNFEYKYGLLSEGLLPRFIVRTHTLSRDQNRWRSGVVLSYEDCNALVKADLADRRVIVRVKDGTAEARRRLLAIIRYDLDRIHAEFKDRLDVQARVPLTHLPTIAVEYKKLIAFERRGIREFPEFIGQDVVTISVPELLNGIDFAEQRDESLDAVNRSKSVFFSYSHRDEGLRDELETHLKLLQRQRIISLWHDRKISSGDEWEGEIDGRLERASIILLLVSSDFIGSSYCWDCQGRFEIRPKGGGKSDQFFS